MKKIVNNLRGKIQVFIKDERGEFGIKQIAITLGVIMLVGVVVGIISGLMPNIIQEVWNYLFLQIQNLTSTI